MQPTGIQKQFLESLASRSKCPRAGVSSLVGQVGSQVVLGLVSGHWWVPSCARVSAFRAQVSLSWFLPIGGQGQGPEDLEDSTRPLVSRAMSWGLWLQGPRVLELVSAC